MAAITVSAANVTNIDAVVGRTGNDTFSIAGDNTSALVVDQDSRYGLNATPTSGGMGTVTPSQTLGGTFFIDGRYVRIIPYNNGTGSVPPPGVTVTKGSASGTLIGVYDALNVSPESVGAAMPADGYIKIKAWNETAFTSGALTIPGTTGVNLVSANVSNMEGTGAAAEFTVTAGAATLSNSLTFAQLGSKSMRIATTTTSDTTVKMATGTRFLVGAGLNVTVSGYIRGSDVKSCTLDIEWFDSANASISTTTIQTQNCSNSAFTQYTSAAVAAPANTKWASVNTTITAPTNGGFYYLDNVTVTPGNWTTAADATGADRVGWIEVVGVEGALHIFSSSNQTYQSDFSMCKGSWYEVGTTDANRATTYQLPTNGAACYHGGVLVDKAAATTITAASWASSVATFTSTAHGLTTGDRVFIDEVLPIGYTSNRNLIEACTVTGANTFTIPMATDPGSYTSGGTVAAVEWFSTTTALNTTIRTERVPGSVCWLDTATGLLRFGNDNITSTGGYCPATGLKVRIPNVITAGVASGYATPLTNTLHATLGSRVRYYGGNAGICVVNQMSGSWSPSVFQTGKFVKLKDSTFVGVVSISGQASPCEVIHCCLGGNTVTTATAGTLIVLTHTSGITITDCMIGVGDLGLSNRVGFSFSTAEDIVATGNTIMGTGDRSASGTWGFSLNIGNNATITDTTIANCGGVVTSSQYSNFTLRDTNYWGSGVGYVSVTNGQAMFVAGNVSTGWVIDGFTVDQPAPFNVMRGSWITIGSSSSDGIYRNMGTYATPIDTGTATFRDKAVSRVTTTATVTHVAHGYRNNDVIFVMVATDTTTSPISSWQNAITIALKTITVTGNDTFTFTCTNAGSTTGTIDYYAAGIASTILSIGAAKNILLQNIHLRSHSTSSLSGASSVDGLTLQNVTFDYRWYNTTTINRASQNQKYTSGYVAAYEFGSPASSIFGNHYADFFVRPTTTPGTDALVSGVSWTRSASVLTVTSTAHGLEHNNRIYVSNSSNQATMPNGVKQVTVTVIDKNVFTVTGVSTGSASGTLDYRLPGDGYAIITGDEASTETAAFVTASGSAAFTGNGTLYVPAVNDTVEWEQEDWMIGFDHFGQFPGQTYGGGGNTSTNFDLYYQLNTGAGFSAWKNLQYNRAGGGGSSASTTVTMTSTTGVAVNDYVNGIGIADNTKVVSVDSGTNITVTVANTAAVTGVLTFYQHPNEADFPSTGIKLKVKSVTNTTNTSTMYQLHIPFVSTETSRARLYDQSEQVDITITAKDSDTLDPIENARVYIVADSGGDMTEGDLVTTGLTDVNGEYTDAFGFTNDQPVLGWARKSTSSPLYKQAPIGGTITSDGFTTSAFLVPDE